MATPKELNHQMMLMAEARSLDALLEVYSTDHTEVHGELLYQGYHRDIAETKMMLEFRKTGYQVSFLVFNHKTNANEALCFSENDRAARNDSRIWVQR